jgi:hypothetical protein
MKPAAPVTRKFIAARRPGTIERRIIAQGLLRPGEVNWYHKRMRWLERTLRWLRKGLALLFLALLLGRDVIALEGPVERVRLYTRKLEFEFVGWTLGAAGVKLAQWSLGQTAYLREDDRRPLPLSYLELVREQDDLQRKLTEIYADPEVQQPEAAAAPVRTRLNEARAEETSLQPVAESVMQEMTAFTLGDLGLDVGGAAFPPVSFRFSTLPVALIVSPRDAIRQEANLQLLPDLSLEDQIQLEKEVETNLGVSALVVPVGGIGTYPTMIEHSTDLVWLFEVVAHEWVHNYLTLRPLGLSYETSQELRTMNETVASILGKEIGRRALELYYPDRVPPPAPEEPAPSIPGEPPAFDFRAEMRETRVTVDRLLAEGRIDEAESYMEERRQFFWRNGYHHIRRINQAYFAFYGTYADEPGGAAGEDPVGEAVRMLWGRIHSPAKFLRTMAWMNEFSDLQKALGGMPGQG